MRHASPWAQPSGARLATGRPWPSSGTRPERRPSTRPTAESLPPHCHRTAKRNTVESLTFSIDAIHLTATESIRDPRGWALVPEPDRGARGQQFSTRTAALYPNRSQSPADGRQRGRRRPPREKESLSWPSGAWPVGRQVAPAPLEGRRAWTCGAEPRSTFGPLPTNSSTARGPASPSRGVESFRIRV